MSYINWGDHNVICDRTGYKLKRSECRVEWNNLIVRAGSWEERHPQDFLRSIPDHQAVADARPRSVDVFLSDNEVKAEDL